ncbi:MAG: twin-arginine translocation signal domain-containing protein, partial [Pseudomonadales bacterium]|nr:twin-arginine translocation signal domain-containing protein [Pseudomonadales bacterium]
MSGVSLGRRRFLALAATATVAGVAGIPLFHYRFKTPADALPGPRTRPRLGTWEDLYRQRWTWDKIAKGT